MSEIILTTLNARYSHASLGLRYLMANLGEFRGRTLLAEFTIKRPPAEIVAEILRAQPKIVGFGTYIWNVKQTLEVVRQLKTAQPDLIILAGGPEISFETEGQELFHAVDYVLKGEADFSLREFLAQWDRGERPGAKIISGPLPDIKAIRLPYDLYSADDIANRTLYVEASRGCPYKCEYCLSALDVSVRNFPLDEFLAQMQSLLDRGARQFKFVDRTFNLAPTTSSRILKFFLERIHLGLFLHFELVPDRLPPELKELIQQFPAGALQFEIGIQTWSEKVARNVSRRQDFTKIADNLRYLREHTGVHTHADLIVGLPGETWNSFAQGFNALYALGPDEIQVGILKRLKGTPIIRHDQMFGMKYATEPPFQILENNHLNAEEILNLEIFADFWDLVANSGRFPDFKEIVEHSGQTPFEFYYDLSQRLYRHFGRTHSIHLRDLEQAVALAAVRRESATTALPQRQALHVRAGL